MTRIYFNVIDKNLNSGFDYKFSKLSFDFMSKPENISADDPLIQNSEMIFNYIMGFPGRTVDSVKMEFENDKFLVYKVDSSHSEQNWYGVTLVVADKCDLPLKRELDLSREVYDIVEEYYKLRNFEYSQGKLVKLFLYYKKDPSNDLLRTLYSDKACSLEETIIPSVNDSIAKWDFFLFDAKTGAPINSQIYRYYYKINKDYNQSLLGFFKLDMERVYNLPNYKEQTTLSEIHLTNCMSLNAFISICKLLSENLELGKIKSLLINTNLHNNLGTGVSRIYFIEEQDLEIGVALDIKNKLHSKDTQYTGKHFGKEDESIKRVIKDLKKNSIDFQLLQEGDVGENNNLFKIVKESLPENSKFLRF